MDARRQPGRRASAARSEGRARRRRHLWSLAPQTARQRRHEARGAGVEARPRPQRLWRADAVDRTDSGGRPGVRVARARKSVVYGKSVSVRVEPGGRGIIKTKYRKKNNSSKTKRQ